jgi:WD40 repeat protein
MKRLVLILTFVCLLRANVVPTTAQNAGPRARITPDNAEQVTQLAMIGRGRIHDLALSTDGKMLAVATSLGVWLYDIENLEGEPHWVQSPAMWVNSVAFNPDSTLLAFDAGTNQVQLCDARTGERVLLLEIQPWPGLLRRVTWSPDGTTLTVENDHGAVYEVAVETGSVLHELESVAQVQEKVVQVSSPNGIEAYASVDGRDDTVRVFDEQGQLAELTGFHAGVTSVAFSPKEDLLAFGTGDGRVWMWDMNTRQYLRSTRGHTGFVDEVTFSQDGAIVVSAASRFPYYGYEQSTERIPAAVRLWDAATGTLLRTLYDPTGDVWTVAYSPDGTQVAAAGGWGDRTVRLWDISDRATTTDESPRILAGHSGVVRTVVFSPDGTVLASGSEDGTVRLWEMPTGAERVVFEGNGSAVHSVTFSPDGTALAVAQGSQVWLWEVATGESRQFVYDPPPPAVLFLSRVAFSPDGTILAAGGGLEHRIWLWDVATGEELAHLTGQSTHDVQSLAFSPDGTVLASAALDGAVWLWGVP